MNKQIIITILFSLVAIAGQGQIHYRLEGNIGMPDFTGVMEIKDVLKQQSVDTIKVVNGIITPKCRYYQNVCANRLRSTKEEQTDIGDAVYRQWNNQSGRAKWSWVATEWYIYQ